MLTVGTVFSGIGAVEHALKRMGVEHQIAFACDNGDVDILSKKIEKDVPAISHAFLECKEEIDKIEISRKFEDRKQDICTRYNNLKADFKKFKSDNKKIDLEDKVIKKQIRDYAEKLGMIFELIETVKIYNDLEAISDYKNKKEYVDKLYEGKEAQNKVMASYFANYDIKKENFHWNVSFLVAYALTVHKAQGSEFGKVILVISEPCGLLSKELLYTAITRQTERLVILYNAEAYHLRNYSSKAFSDIARRFTSLFEKPEIIEFKQRYYEASLIHKTLKGELVRSKSEVIIANMLFEAGIPYEYEKELSLGEDGIRIPDFTIDDAESGMLFYWEHCGMMSDRHYRQRWDEKKAVYAKHDIVEGENLIVSYDDLNGSIDSVAIKKLIEQYLC